MRRETLSGGRWATAQHSSATSRNTCATPAPLLRATQALPLKGEEGACCATGPVATRHPSRVGDSHGSTPGVGRIPLAGAWVAGSPGALRTVFQMATQKDAAGCRRCGSAIVGRYAHARYCSDRCRRVANRESAAAAKAAALRTSDRPCRGCSASIPDDRGSRARYCSRRCSQRAEGLRNQAARNASALERRRTERPRNCTCGTSIEGTPGSTRRCLSCRPVVVPNGQPRSCPQCGQPFLTIHPNHVFCSRLCVLQARGGNSYRRQATRAALAERDGARCHLCRKPIDMAVAYPDPRSASIDHLVPVADGGTNDAANLALAHLACNIARSTGGDVQLRVLS